VTYTEEAKNDKKTEEEKAKTDKAN